MIINEKAQIISEILERNLNNKRITNEVASNINRMLDAEVLRIGVIGKMKAGKSSFINSLVFGDTVLPTGSTPVTATLTEIEFGTTESVAVSLINEKDVDDLKAALDSNIEAEKKNAEQILNTLNSIEGGYHRFIAPGDSEKIVSITPESLSDYVSADGKYSGLVKTVKIKKDNPRIKGLVIVDTPGFNDPIISRGRTTIDQLKNCSIIFFVHDPYEAYDEIDISMLEQQIEYAGISELVDVINKVDWLDDYKIDEWGRYNEEYSERKEAILNHMSESAAKELLRNSKTLVVSSLLALLGCKSKDAFSDEEKEWYTQLQSTFPDYLIHQKDFYSYSLISSILDEVEGIIQKKDSYLLRAPIETLKGELKIVLKKIDRDIDNAQSDIANLESAVELAQKKLNQFESFFSVLLRDVHNLSLPQDLTGVVNKEELDLKKLRSSESEGEFTITKYPDPDLLSSGVKKRNLGNFNIFISEFDDLLRDRLEALRETIRSKACNSVVKVLSMLTTEQIDESTRKSFESTLYNSIEPAVQDISFPILSQALNDSLKGKQPQYVLYQIKFNNLYNDNWIHEKLGGFYAKSETIVQSFQDNAKNEITRIKLNLSDSIHLDPDSKKEKIANLHQLLLLLNQEKEKVNDDITLL